MRFVRAGALGVALSLLTGCAANSTVREASSSPPSRSLATPKSATSPDAGTEEPTSHVPRVVHVKGLPFPVCVVGRRGHIAEPFRPYGDALAATAYLLAARDAGGKCPLDSPVTYVAIRNNREPIRKLDLVSGPLRCVISCQLADILDLDGDGVAEIMAITAPFGGGEVTGDATIFATSVRGSRLAVRPLRFPRSIEGSNQIAVGSGGAGGFMSGLVCGPVTGQGRLVKVWEGSSRNAGSTFRITIARYVVRSTPRRPVAQYVNTSVTHGDWKALPLHSAEDDCGRIP